jgi:hypothetical protein
MSVRMTGMIIGSDYKKILFIFIITISIHLSIKISYTRIYNNQQYNTNLEGV